MWRLTDAEHSAYETGCTAGRQREFIERTRGLAVKYNRVIAAACAQESLRRPMRIAWQHVETPDIHLVWDFLHVPSGKQHVHPFWNLAVRDTRYGVVSYVLTLETQSTLDADPPDPEHSVVRYAWVPPALRAVQCAQMAVLADGQRERENHAPDR